jgi:hypothetical protein
VPTTIDATVHPGEDGLATSQARSRRAGGPRSAQIPARARQALVAVGAVTATAAVLAVASSIAGQWG